MECVGFILHELYTVLNVTFLVPSNHTPIITFTCQQWKNAILKNAVIPEMNAVISVQPTVKVIISKDLSLFSSNTYFTR